MNGEYLSMNTAKYIEKLKTTIKDNKEHYGEFLLEKDKEIERLKGALQTHEILLKSNALEIERLNNIINELERLLNNQIENYKDSECEELQAMVQEDKSILFILKELKGSE